MKFDLYNSIKLRALGMSGSVCYAIHIVLIYRETNRTNILNADYIISNIHLECCFVRNYSFCDVSDNRKLTNVVFHNFYCAKTEYELISRKLNYICIFNVREIYLDGCNPARYPVRSFVQK